MPESAPPDNQNTATQTENLSIAEIRRLKRAQRKTFSDDEQKGHSCTLRQLIIQQSAYKKSQNIACYLANDGEINPGKIIEHAWFNNKNIYLPVLSPLKNSLYFAAYTRQSKFKKNRFGIPEPVCHPSQWLKASQLDLMLLPLVAFDPQGNRMGMGGGFYDRTLAYLQHRQYWRRPILLGLAHEIQRTDQLKSQYWDIPVSAIVTEKKVYRR